MIKFNFNKSIYKKKLLIIFFLLTFYFPIYAKKPTLYIYTYNSFYSYGPGKKIKQIFEKNHNCEVKFISMGNSISILNRLKMEGKNSLADIIIGLDNNIINNAEKTNLFVEHNININNLKLPMVWKNKYFIPYDYSYFTFIYNKTKLKKPPEKFIDILENEWKIIYEDPRTSTLGLGLLLWIQKMYGDQAKYIWSKISKKTVTITKGWSEAYNLFLKGEADFMFSYTTSILQSFKNLKANNYAALYFTEGHYLQVEVAGQLKTSKNPKLANKFMQFILSKQFQDIIIKYNWMYPVINTILPKELNDLLIPNTIFEYTPKEIDDNYMKWIHTWQNAIQ